MYCCTLPGRMISWAGADGFGETTDTAVRATCAVSAFSVVRALTRDKMPETNRAAIAINAIARPNHRRYGRCCLPTRFDGSVCPPICFLSSLCCDIFLSLVCCDIMTPHRFLLSAGIPFALDAGANPAKR